MKPSILFTRELQQLGQLTEVLQTGLMSLTTNRMAEEARLLQLIQTMVEALTGNAQY